ncbi:MAG: hypothetical protein P1U56_15490 [Saprospiraceae bacterium]|nr:hypothetical protein [Saprospiraceae bacterium]
MKKSIVAFFVMCSFACLQNLNAQASSKLFQSVGYTTQVQKVPFEGVGFSGNSFSGRTWFVGAGFLYNLRFNITEMGDNSSIGLSSGLVVALDYGFDEDLETSYGGLYLPIHLNYNVGAGSTYDTDKDFGVGLGVGLTPSYMPLFGNTALRELRLSPSVKLSLRFWAAGSNALNEYFIRFDKYPSGNTELGGDTSLPFMITLGKTRYIGY